MDADLGIAAAHKISQQLEKHLRACVPSLGRVVIHVEPVGEAKKDEQE